MDQKRGSGFDLINILVHQSPPPHPLSVTSGIIQLFFFGFHRDPPAFSHLTSEQTRRVCDSSDIGRILGDHAIENRKPCSELDDAESLFYWPSLEMNP